MGLGFQCATGHQLPQEVLQGWLGLPPAALFGQVSVRAGAGDAAKIAAYPPFHAGRCLPAPLLPAPPRKPTPLPLDSLPPTLLLLHLLLLGTLLLPPAPSPPRCRGTQAAGSQEQVQPGDTAEGGKTAPPRGGLGLWLGLTWD